MTDQGPWPGRAIGGIIGLPPGVTLRSAALADVEAAVVAVVLASSADGPVLAAAAREVGTELGLDLDLLIGAESLRGDAGTVLLVPLARSSRPTRLLIVGIGAGLPGDWRAAGAALARRSGAPDRLALVAEPDDRALRAFVEGFGFGSYRISGLLDRAGRSGRGDDARAAGPGPASAAVAGSGAVDVLGAGDLGVSDPDVNDLGSGGSGVAVVGTHDPGVNDLDAAGSAPSAVAAAAEVEAEVNDATGPAAQNAPAASGSSAPAELVILTDRAGDPGAVGAVAAALAVATGVYIARDLVNTPSLVKSPAWLADRAVRIATAAGLTATVLGPAELAEQGFGGLRAVGEGSPRPPCLVRLEYQGPPVAPAARPRAPDGRDGRPTGRFAEGHRVLVGKGITFDSGGLSLKPPVSMIGMKTDMSGAAAVLGAMTTLPALNVPGRVTGLLCLAENMIGASAMRPGDVITCWGGTTVEVLNTDAEGRLVLADGLAYAAGALDADVIVDLATLTGAIAVALGRRTAGLFSSDDELAAALSAAAEAAGERVWRLPLVDEYRPAIDSPVADLANMGRAMDVGGGSITAALFLREFAARRPWAHLDIAGTARSDSDDGEISRGGTGWGVRTLLTWLAPDVTWLAPEAPEASPPAADAVEAKAADPDAVKAEAVGMAAEVPAA